MSTTNTTAKSIATQLSVNINKIALLRNSREGDYPNIVEHALACIKAGAHGITIHPRPDQRHIRASDAQDLKDNINVELNIEGNPFAQALKSKRHDVDDYPGFIPLVMQTVPAQCTLVPDSEDQLTSDHGFNLIKDGEKLAPIIEQLQAHNIRVSLFMSPEIEQITIAKQLNTDRIELYTGPFAAAYQQQNSAAEALFERYKNAAVHAIDLGLELNAGHDLNLENIQTIRSLMPHLHEVSIGHALTVEAIHFGLEETISRYLQQLS